MCLNNHFYKSGCFWINRNFLTQANDFNSILCKSGFLGSISPSSSPKAATLALLFYSNRVTSILTSVNHTTIIYSDICIWSSFPLNQAINLNAIRTLLFRNAFNFNSTSCYQDRIIVIIGVRFLTTT